MPREAGLLIVVLLALSVVAIGCQPAGEADLEIVEITPASPGPWSYGDTASFRVAVRNNGPGRAITVAAAIAADAASGLLHKGPAVEIRRNQTADLALEIPLEAPYVKRCRLETNVFLARPGEPGNFFRDLWTDPVPENHAQDVVYPLERILPTGIEAPAALTEVVEPTNDDSFRRRYEGPLDVIPEGSAWAIDRVLVQTQDSRGMPIELLHADLLDGRLTTVSVIWDGAERTRDSVVQAVIAAYYRDCGGAEAELRDRAVAVALEPR